MKSLKKILIGILVIVATFFVWSCDSPSGNDSKVKELILSQDVGQKEKIDELDTWLQGLHEEDHFNGGVLLIKNDSVIFKKTYGYTDYTKSKKLTSSSSFRLASVSKQFTAVGIMLLKEQGKLEFDDSVTKYLPALKYKEATIRNLLNHTSGIPDAYMGFPEKYKDEVGTELEISEVVSLLAKADLPFASKPNEKFQYNNTGYVLLAAIVESVSGESFESFMNRELFSKLEMPNARVWNLVSKNPDYEMKTGSFEYENGKITELPPTVFDGISGDGGIFCSLDDFIIWNQFWIENPLLSSETMAEAFMEVTLLNGEKSSYGFGWNSTPNGGAWHNGSWLGARTLIARNSNSKNCIVVLDNSSSAQVDFIAQQLAKVLK